MEKTSWSWIIRRSIHVFLHKYQHFTLSAALLAFPFSAAVLFSQIFLPSSSFIQARMELFFYAAGFPSSSRFFSLLNLKLSQTISSSLLTFPLSISSILLSKAFVIHLLCCTKPVLGPLLATHLCNSLLLLSVNATAFCILAFIYNLLEFLNLSSSSVLIFSLSAIGAIVYSSFLARVLAVRSLALVTSGMERCGGFFPILKAYVLIRGKTSEALAMVLPTNMAMAAVEALFYYRITGPFHLSRKLTVSLSMEAVFIAYLYSITLVMDAITSCMFCKSLQPNPSDYGGFGRPCQIRITVCKQ